MTLKTLAAHNSSALDTQAVQYANGATSLSYDALNRLTSRDTSARPLLGYGYDPVGNLTRSTEGGQATDYEYDEVGQLSGLTTADGQRTTFLYDGSGRRTQTRYPNGVTQFTGYDKSGRLTSVGAAKSGQPSLTSLTYCYSTANPCATSTSTDTDLRQWVRDDVTGTTTTYTYTDDSELSRAAASSGTTWTYTYDSAGNRTTDTTTGKPSHGYGYDPGDALCTSAAGTTSRPTCTTAASGSVTTFDYDGTGNLLGRSAGPTSTYNARSQTTRYGTATFSYAGPDQNDRLSRTDPTGTATFTNGRLGLQQQTASAGTTTFTRTPDGQLISMRTGSGERQYYLTDGLGSVIGLTDTNGNRTASYSYDPYGQTLTATGAAAAANPYRYTGGYHDSATGLYKLGIRYYDPSIGRFTQPDPTGQDVGYLYTGNNPTNYTDLTGGDFGVTLTPRDLAALAAVSAGATAIAATIQAATGVGVPTAAVTAIVGTLVSTGLGVLSAYGCSVDININTGFFDIVSNGPIDLSIYGCSRR